MGDVDKVLSVARMKDKALWGHDLRIESCEAIHVYWRDCRLLMAPDQFEAFARDIGKAVAAWDGTISGERDTVLHNSVIPNDKLGGETLFVEKIKGHPAVHIHYGDLRIEMMLSRFFMVGDTIRQALVESFFKMIRCEDINPYDHIHKPTKEEWGDAFVAEKSTKEAGYEDWERHHELAKFYGQAIQKGYQISPIIVTAPGKDGGKYQRRDGFCRYTAYTEVLGYRNIPCYIVPEEVALWQPQHGGAPFIGGFLD